MTLVKSGPHNFGDVIELLRDPGTSALRHGWEHTPSRPRIVLVPGSEIVVSGDRPLGAALPDQIGQTVTYSPHFDVATNDGRVQVWVPTHADLLADDWYML